VRIYVENGRNADARRLDYVDDMDANAGSNMAYRSGIVCRYVDGDDGRNDAAVVGSKAMALSPIR